MGQVGDRNRSNGGQATECGRSTTLPVPGQCGCRGTSERGRRRSGRRGSHWCCCRRRGQGRRDRCYDPASESEFGRRPHKEVDRFERRRRRSLRVHRKPCRSSRCFDLHLALTVELTPDVPSPSEPGPVSSLLGNHVGYRLTLMRQITRQLLMCSRFTGRAEGGFERLGGEFTRRGSSLSRSSRA